MTFFKPFFFSSPSPPSPELKPPNLASEAQDPTQGQAPASKIHARAGDLASAMGNKFKETSMWLLMISPGAH